MTTTDPLSDGISRRSRTAQTLEKAWIEEAMEFRRKKIKTPADELRFDDDFGTQNQGREKENLKP